MAQTLVLVHTLPPLVPVFATLARQIMPDVKILHILDEPLLATILQRGSLADDDVDRLVSHAAAAERSGAAAMLVTCSTISPCVDAVSPRAHIPVIKIDEAMVAEAVRLGTRIGVVATNKTTLEPTRALIEQRAQIANKQVSIELVMVDGALPALLGGDGETHDALVASAVYALARRSDVIVLAQASMARVVAVLDQAKLALPVLSSPHLALQQVRQLLASGRPQGA